MATVQLILISALLLTAVTAQPSRPIRVEPVITTRPAGGPSSCPISENITSSIFEGIKNQYLMTPCGGFGWRQVVDLDMEVTSQQCPSPWLETLSTPSRSCRFSINSGGCESVFFHVSGATYQRVCGRAVGYTVGTPDAFFNHPASIDAVYTEGVSITHGSPRQHIWSFVAGDAHRCPCDSTDRLDAPSPRGRMIISVMENVMGHCGMVRTA